MKQKYIIKKDDTKNILVIKEYAELDKEITSFMGEQEYDREDIIRGIAGGSDELVKVLRNHDFYPPQLIVDKIAEKITEIYDADTNDAVELLLNDVDFLVKDEPKEQPAIPKIEEDVDDDDAVDDLLDESRVDSENIANKDTAIKVADADTLDGDIENDSKG